MTTAYPPVPPARVLPYDADFTMDPPEALVAAKTRRLVLRWIWTATAFFFVAGSLGLLLRLGQAEFISLDGNLWYAVMTAHGLGAFVAWAGFFLMGISFWVLHKCGFPIRNFLWAELTYWSMVLGVVGIVLTTLLGGFGGSWVFLYPLAFHSAGQWSDMVTGVFSVSVLLAGVSILAYCAAMLHQIISPALKAEKDTIGQRIGLAFGFGLLWPSRFRTTRGREPYPVLPLAVNAFISNLSFGARSGPFLQGLVAIAVVLCICLSVAAALRGLQHVVAEVIQRRKACATRIAELERERERLGDLEKALNQTSEARDAYSKALKLQEEKGLQKRIRAKMAF